MARLLPKSAGNISTVARSIVPAVGAMTELLTNWKVMLHVSEGSGTRRLKRSSGVMASFKAWRISLFLVVLMTVDVLIDAFAYDRASSEELLACGSWPGIGTPETKPIHANIEKIATNMVSYSEILLTWWLILCCRILEQQISMDCM